MGNRQSKDITATNVNQHAKDRSIAASRLAVSHACFKPSAIVNNDVGDFEEDPVWVKQNDKMNEETYDKFKYYFEQYKEQVIIKETVLNRGFDKRCCLPPIPQPPRSDAIYSENHYDIINGDILEVELDQTSYSLGSLYASCDTHLLQTHMSLVVSPDLEQTMTQITQETASCSQEQISHEMSECLGYEEMVEIFKPLIVTTLIVHEILPHLSFIEDHDEIYITEKSSPRKAVISLLNELKSCKEVGKWHRFLDALQLCGYEYIVQNIKGYKFINHTYQHEYIRKLTGKLNKMIRARELLPRLYAEGLISQNDKEEIQQEDTNFGNIAASTLLLDRIHRKLSTWYTTFIGVLRDEGFREIAEMLDIPHLIVSSKIKMEQLHARSQVLNVEGTFDEDDILSLTPSDMISTLPAVSSTQCSLHDRPPIPTPRKRQPSPDTSIGRATIPISAEMEDELFEESKDEIFQPNVPPIPPRLPKSENTSPQSNTRCTLPLASNTKCLPPKPSFTKKLLSETKQMKFKGEGYEEWSGIDLEGALPSRPSSTEKELMEYPEKEYLNFDGTVQKGVLPSRPTLTQILLAPPPPPIPPRLPKSENTCNTAEIFREYGTDQIVKDNNSLENIELREEFRLNGSEQRTYGDEFYGYEPYNMDVPADICRSKHSQPKNEIIIQVDDKFLSLKKELVSLQNEEDDLDVEITHLQKKNDLQSNVNNKLRQKSEILQNIDVKEKEAAALKYPLDPQDKTDYYCPESARVFWKNQNSLFNAVPKTTMHFENNFAMGSVVLQGDPIRLYDSKNRNGNTKWSYTDSAIDCVY